MSLIPLADKKLRSQEGGDAVIAVNIEQVVPKVCPVKGT
jgi:hypothetical protein